MFDGFFKFLPLIAGWTKEWADRRRGHHSKMQSLISLINKQLHDAQNDINSMVAFFFEATQGSSGGGEFPRELTSKAVVSLAVAHKTIEDNKLQLGVLYEEVRAHWLECFKYTLKISVERVEKPADGVRTNWEEMKTVHKDLVTDNKLNKSLDALFQKFRTYF